MTSMKTTVNASLNKGAPCSFMSTIRAVRAQAKSAGGRTIPLNVDTISPLVRTAEYAVRGEITIRANNYKSRLAKGDKSLPFDEIVECNVGNPQAVGQKPITFFRQVLSLVTYPKLLESKDIAKNFHSDAITKAKDILKIVPAGSGAYSHSMGIPGIRKKVAEFIERRDGYPSDPEKIFLTDGASISVKNALQLLIRGKSDGIMVPIPQYPLYSASIALFGGSQVDYLLDEKKGWGTDIAELRRAYDKATNEGICVRALVVINPGNPTGQALSEESMKQIVRFCEETGVTLFADEVYQVNIYGSTPFNSFKKIVCDMKADVGLISFYSASKGFTGECGRRGGYMEVHNLHDDVVMQLYKLSSVTLCSNIDGQIMMALIVDPPKEGGDAHAQYLKEGEEILASLKHRSSLLVKTLNDLEGVNCNPVEGALYAFPQITLPTKAIAAAKKAGKAPDVFYCLELLDNTGILVVPGSGFGQAEGTFHFRTTILPPPEKIMQVSKLLAKFHGDFMAKYS
mmetsp:Transcript_20448/g.28531  ORF Transcript_20448/g.28531 Transcript_20448/m.28531 type:complete len:513 (+) Transcript_20448:273-1811(+)|eukprot:CAMPEP_0184480738 /NCGR_PEP_ID=MMETSP0113_2-20130426/2266_1 /TAXON_ID=91329 /ORGANISM="Norrisiella sphaerica, Strain BC52" /LENGTH=512 /DNA_ID=CAMNT_0026859439 /DNA_START=271 /DNA_END=1809 /DNA_ORIENTATION=-